MVLQRYKVKKYIQKYKDQNVIGNCKPNSRKLILSQHISIDNDEIYQGGSPLNTLIIGNMHSGKGLNFLIPNILDMPQNTHYIIIDQGGVLWASTHKYFLKQGYNVFFFDPFDDNAEKFETDNYFINKTAIFIRTGRFYMTANVKARVFFSKCLEECYKKSFADTPEPRSDYKVRVIMDDIAEMKNIKKDIPNFLYYLETGYLRGISFQISAQNIEQLILTFEDNWDAVLHNMFNILFLGKINDINKRDVYQMFESDPVWFRNKFVGHTDLSSMTKDDILILIKEHEPVIDTKYKLSYRYLNDIIV